MSFGSIRVTPTHYASEDDPGYVVVGQGVVDEFSWTLALAKLGPDIGCSFFLDGSNGGYGSADVAPARPPPGRKIGCRMGGNRYLVGWLDHAVIAVEAEAQSGEIVRLPVLGERMDLVVNFFAVPIPQHEQLVIVRALGPEDSVLDSTDASAFMRWGGSGR